MFDVSIWCASHLNSKERLGYMKEMLESVRGQSRTPDKFIISISYADPISSAMVDELVGSHHDMGYIQWIVHSEPKSQFDHYLHIYLQQKEEIEQGQDDHEHFITFVDDDDLLHPERLARGCDIPDGYDGTICKYSDELDLVNHPVRTEQRDWYEYVCLVLRWFVIDEIFSLRDDPVLSMINLKHPHCDWQLLNCAMRQYTLSESDDVLYFYRQNWK